MKPGKTHNDARKETDAAAESVRLQLWRIFTGRAALRGRAVPLNTHKALRRNANLGGTADFRPKAKSFLFWNR